LFQSTSIAAIIGLMAATCACGTAGNQVTQNETVSQGTVMSISNDMPAPPGGVPVNKRFATLDDYLAWLRQTQAPVDGPWYEEIRPGVYQLRTGNLRILGPEGDETPRDQTFTREQLLKKFGFSK
jgi:hypothetical protein